MRNVRSNVLASMINDSWQLSMYPNDNVSNVVVNLLKLHDHDRFKSDASPKDLSGEVRG